MNRVGRLEEIPPESREVFANGISVCLAGQQLWITTKRAARAPISASATSRGPALAGGRSPSMAASGAVAGRRDPDHLLPGDALDFWRVEAIEPGHLLRLRAEMKLPGLAGIVSTRTAGHTVYRQRASFHSRGLAGHLCWHALLSRHAIVFGGTARNITRAASTPGRSPSVRK